MRDDALDRLIHEVSVAAGRLTRKAWCALPLGAEAYHVYKPAHG